MLDKTGHQSRYVTEKEEEPEPASFMLRCSGSKVSLCASSVTGSFGGDSYSLDSSAFFIDDDDNDYGDDDIIDDDYDNDRWGNDNNDVIIVSPTPIASDDEVITYVTDEFTYVSLESGMCTPKSNDIKNVDHLTFPEECYLSETETDDESISLTGSDFSMSLRKTGVLKTDGNDNRTLTSEDGSYFEETIGGESSKWEIASSIGDNTEYSSEHDQKQIEEGEEDLPLESTSNFNTTTSNGDEGEEEKEEGSIASLSTSTPDHDIVRRGLDWPSERAIIEDPRDFRKSIVRKGVDWPSERAIIEDPRDFRKSTIVRRGVDWPSERAIIEDPRDFRKSLTQIPLAASPAPTTSSTSALERARARRQRVMEKRDRIYEKRKEGTDDGENEYLLNRRKRQHNVCSKLKRLDEHMNAIFGVPVSPNTTLKSEKALSRARAGRLVRGKKVDTRWMADTAMEVSQKEMPELAPTLTTTFRERREELEARRSSLRQAFTMFCSANPPEKPNLEATCQA